VNTSLRVYLIRRTSKNAPSDTCLIKGWPGNCLRDSYPTELIFITSDLSIAEEYRKEMLAAFRRTDFYDIETHTVTLAG
jgi:hypothetical protein